MPRHGARILRLWCAIIFSPLLPRALRCGCGGGDGVWPEDREEMGRRHRLAMLAVLGLLAAHTLPGVSVASSSGARASRQTIMPAAPRAAASTATSEVIATPT